MYESINEQKINIGITLLSCKFMFYMLSKDTVNHCGWSFDTLYRKLCLEETFPLEIVLPQ